MNSLRTFFKSYTLTCHLVAVGKAGLEVASGLLALYLFNF